MFWLLWIEDPQHFTYFKTFHEPGILSPEQIQEVETQDAFFRPSAAWLTIPSKQAELGQVGVAERETGEPNRGLGPRRRVAGDPWDQDGAFVISMSQLWSQVELDDHAFFGQSLEGEWDPDFVSLPRCHISCPAPWQSHGHPRAILPRQDSVFRKRPRANGADGCGIFWRRSKFELVASEARAKLRKPNKKHKKHKNSRRFRDSWWISMNFMIWVLAASLFGRQGFDMIDGNDVSCPCFVPVLRQWENHQPWDLSGFPICHIRLTTPIQTPWFHRA